MKHFGRRLKQYAKNGYRSSEEWAGLGREVVAGAWARVDATLRGRAEDRMKSPEELATDEAVNTANRAADDATRAANRAADAEAAARDRAVDQKAEAANAAADEAARATRAARQPRSPT